MTQDVKVELKRNVLRALSTVPARELDEPITDLGFVKELSISDDGRVSLDLVTSTFWCSPNFVYMMLEEARDVVSKLPGVREMRLTLGGHHDSDRINGAINAGKSFSECYDSEARGDLVELNRMIRTRALRSRLYSMAAAFVRSGLVAEEIPELSRQDVTADGDTFVVNSRGRMIPITDPADVRRVARYLSFLDGLGRTPTCLIVWDLEGNTPPEDEFVTTPIAA